MKQLILFLAVLTVFTTAAKAATEPGYVFILDRVVFSSESQTLDSDQGGVSFNDVRGILVGDKFYISGEICVHAECMTLFEEYWIEEVKDTHITVSDNWQKKDVEIYNDNPLQLVFTTRRGKYAYGFKAAVPAQIDRKKWARQYLSNVSITGGNFLVLIDELNQ